MTERVHAYDQIYRFIFRQTDHEILADVFPHLLPTQLQTFARELRGRAAVETETRLQNLAEDQRGIKRKNQLPDVLRDWT